MCEFLGIPLVIGFVLLVLAVFGHLLWLMGAAVVRSLTGEAAPRKPGELFAHRVRLCPACGTRIVSSPRACPGCGTRLTSRRMWILDSWIEEIGQMVVQGAISPEARDQLLQIIDAERQRLIDQAADARQRQTAQATIPGATPEPSVTEALPPIPARDEWEHAAPREAGTSQVPAGSDTYRLSPLEAEFQTGRAAATCADPAVVPEPAPAHAPMTFASIVQTFMESRNIRWGELMSGMLIVGSAIGLVISLWATLSDTIPYFPALLFLLATAAIHAAGLYTLKRWKLKSTSRGILTIATLLVPLNFLAAVALSEQRSVTDPLFLVVLLVGLASYSAMVWSAGRHLLYFGRWQLFLSVMGASASQVLIGRLAVVGPDFSTLALQAAGPVGSFVVAVGSLCGLAAGWKHVSGRRCVQLLTLLGFATFSAIVALALVLWKSGDWLETASRLAPALSLMAALLPALGLVMQNRLTGERHESLRTAAMSITLVGSVLMLVAVGLAWPHPGRLVLLGVVNFVALTAMARLANFPVLHTGAVASGSLAALVGFHVWRAEMRWFGWSGRELVDVLFESSSAIVLTVIAAVISAGAMGLRRFGRRDEALSYWLSAGGLAAVGALIAALTGFRGGEDSLLATPVLALHTAGLLTTAIVARRAPLAVGGCVLLFVACLQGLGWNEWILDGLTRAGIPTSRPWQFALLISATVAGGLAHVARRVESRGQNLGAAAAVVTRIFVGAGIAYAIASSPGILSVTRQRFDLHAVLAVWSALNWFVLASAWPNRWLFLVGQTNSFVAGGFAVTAFCQSRPWWVSEFRDPRHIAMQCGMLAALGLLWQLARVRKPRAEDAGKPLSTASSEVRLDRAAIAVAVAGQVMLAYLFCAPGIHVELDLSRAMAFGTEATAWTFIGVLLLAAAATLSALWRWDTVGAAGWGFAALLAGVTAFLPPGELAANSYWSSIALDPVSVLGWEIAVPALLATVAGLALLRGPSNRSLESAAIRMLVLAAPVGLLLLAAVRSGDLTAVATNVRWLLTAYFVCVTVATVVWRDTLTRKKSMGAERDDDVAMPAMQSAEPVDAAAWQSALFVLAGVPVLAFTLRYLFLAGTSGDAGSATSVSWLNRLDTPLSYALPVGLLAVGTLGSASARRRPAAWLSMMLLAGTSVATYVLARHFQTGEPFLLRHAVNAVQWTGLTLALLGVTRCFLRELIEAARVEEGSDRLQKLRELSTLTAASLPYALALMAAAGIALLPSLSVSSVDDRGMLWNWPAVLPILGGWKGIAALLLAITAVAWERWNRDREFVVKSLAGGLLLLWGLVAANSTAASTQPGNWQAFHMLEAGWAVVAALLAGIGWYWRASRPADHEKLVSSTAACAVHICLLVLLVALRGAWTDPGGGWWSAGTVLATAACVASVALLLRSGPLTYLACGFVVMATIFVQGRILLAAGEGRLAQASVDAFYLLLQVVIACGGFWLAVRIVWQRRTGDEFEVGPRLESVSSFSARAAVIGLAAMACWGLIWQTRHLTLGWDIVFDVSTPAAGWTAALLAAVLLAALWDRTADYVAAGLYVTGLAAVALGLDERELTTWRLAYETVFALAGFAALTAGLWSARPRLRAFAQELAIPIAEGGERAVAAWLLPSTLWITGLCAVLAVNAALTLPELPRRVAGAIVLFLFVPTMAAFAQEARRPRMLNLALVAGGVAAAATGWAIMPADPSDIWWLHRAIRLMVVLAAVATVYGIPLLRILRAQQERDWFEAARRISIAFGGAALLMLLIVLAMEAHWFVPGQGVATITGLQIAVIAAVLLGLAVTLISLAVLPGLDPLGLSEERRMWYVYTAEVILALQFLHIYLTMPVLFAGAMRPYWPMIVMAIAFFSVGVGEFCKRSGIRVLSEPLQRTGAFLPLIPAIGFWVAAEGVRVEYSSVLFVAGLVYVFLSMWRKSFAAALFAVLAGNAGLWSLWHEQGRALFAHPQWWLVPPALSVLVASHLNRRRLPAAQLTAIRYACTSVIYASSAGEMFLKGVGESMWLPVLLAAFSVAGVLAGIVLRIRAFLYFGSSFLLLSIISMVWHAARNIGHVWPWWAFGICLGIGILTLFGLFEKKRNEMLSVIDGLRQWEK